MQSFKNNILVLIVTLSWELAHQFLIKDKSGPDWDFLIFSQHWPATMCKEWKHRDPSHNCRRPSTKNRWTVHGIWPTKIGSVNDYCNNTWTFDPEQIKSIEKDLEQAWINVFIGSSTYKFWAHEWNKHGTCGTSNKELNSQLKYFSKGIFWNKKYFLSDMLNAVNILPSNIRELRPEELENAIQMNTTKRPSILCWWENELQYLEELRICFDKELNVIDCPDLLFKTCDPSKGIIYPSWSITDVSFLTKLNS